MDDEEKKGKKRPTKPAKVERKKMPLTLDEKAWIVLENEKGVTPMVIAKDIGRPPTTVYTVLGQREKI